MKPYIADFEVNTDVTSYFLVPEAPVVKKAKNNKPYLCIVLSDMTGTIDARYWDMPAGLDSRLPKGTVVKAMAQVTEWDGKKQLSITKIRPVDESDVVEQGDLFERSERDPREMLEDLREIVRNVDNSYLAILLETILEQNEAALLMAPAAKSVHHNYLGGLLEHVLSLCHAASMIYNHYGLDEDLLITACILHDIGKVRELSYPYGISYTAEGTLLGHIVIGMSMVSKAIDDMGNFPPELKMQVMHLIAAHHGTLAWGSPKVPLMREAIVFHLLDMIDSKVAICNRAIKKGINEQGLTEWVRELEGPLYQPPQE